MPTPGKGATEPTNLAISVVVASGAGGRYLYSCLESLREQAAESGSEVLVVDRCGDEVADTVQRRFPFAKLIRADSDTPPSVPAMRKIGVEQASGDIVAVIEEHCAARPDWLRTIRRSWREGDAAIGGPVLDRGYRNPRDWAIYLSEFHNYLPPWPEGERYALNGVNIAYSRRLLKRHAERLSDGYWEVVLHPKLASDGAFRSVPEMQVTHAGPFDFGLYLRQRYLLSRVWGGGQRSRISPARRWIYLLAAPLFPPLLLARIASRTARSRRLFGHFFVSLPWLLPIAVAYVAGEWAGYAFGTGGALELVE